MADEQLIFGIRAVMEALQAGKTLDKLMIQRGLSNELFYSLRKLLNEKKVPYQFVPPEKLNRLVKGNHQGVVAYLSEIKYFKTEQLLPEIVNEGKTPFILILDRITDVRNFGAIARSAECAGVDFIVIPSRGSAQINADAVKTSAGALHRIKVCREENLKVVIDYLKEKGIFIVACHEKTDNLLYDVDFNSPLAILLGSEENGISGEYVKRCDKQVKIPMIGGIASLNVSVAAGVVMYEVVRQRGFL